MADNSIDLKTALQMFSQGAQEYGLAQAIAGAQEKVQQIKMAGLKDAEQRRALGDIAQQLTGRMISMGASAAAVQQAAGSVMPTQYGSADQAIFQGTLSGDKAAVEAGLAAQMAQRQDELMMLKAKSDIAEAAQKRLFEHQEKIIAAKAGRQAPTAEQWKAGGFALRLQEAENVFSNLEASGFNPAGVVAGVESKLPNVLRSAVVQRQDQAQRDFINAVLRRESGAAISPAEFENAQKQYFPAMGDSQEVLKQKRQNRATVIKSLSAEGAGAMERIPNNTASGFDITAKYGTGFSPVSMEPVKEAQPISKPKLKITFK